MHSPVFHSAETRKDFSLPPALYSASQKLRSHWSIQSGFLPHGAGGMCRSGRPQNTGHSPPYAPEPWGQQWRPPY